ncbi:MAG TPA: cytochrome P450 [Acidimicrobiia bacterium]|nr:cytochrome P450 [Acidimicrobiia bacterium]
MTNAHDGFDPNAAPWRDDPHPALAEFRRDQPVFHCPAADAWIITRYEDVAAVVSDGERFSSAQLLTRLGGGVCPEAQRVMARGYPPSQTRSIIMLDPPDHGPIRKVVASAFTPRRVAGLEPRVRAIADGLVDAFAADGQVDLVKQFAYPLPLAVIMELLEIPVADRDDIKRWGDDRVSLVWGELSDEEQVRCANSYLEFQSYLGALVDERRARPGDDFISDLASAVTSEGRQLERAELIGQLISVVSAGHETTTNLIAMAVALLLTTGQWDDLVADPTRASAVVEETLRYDGPAKGIPRTTTSDVELSGVRIPAGDRVLAMMTSANHDDRFFTDPDRFDIHRPRPDHPHLGFGRGHHYCAGAGLARLEGRVALEVLVDRLPGMRLESADPLQFTANIVLRTVRQLRLRWEVGTAPAPERRPEALVAG